VAGAGLPVLRTAAACHAGAPGIEWLDIALVGSLALAALLYALGIARMWSKAGPGRGVTVAQAVVFALGWLTTCIALLGPLHALAAQRFWAHMVQHELLIAAAAPLLVLGRPLAAWSWAAPDVARGWAQLVWRHARVRRGWAMAASLPGAFVAHASALWLWHAPALFQWTLASEPAHALAHASFIFTGTLFWAAALDRAQPSAVVYLFLFMLHSTVLGTLIALSPVVWYPVYRTGLDDQQLGGLIMWVPGSVSYLIAALVILVPLLAHDRRTAEARHAAR
jgi:putative membrane protein